VLEVEDLWGVSMRILLRRFFFGLCGGVGGTDGYGVAGANFESRRGLSPTMS